MLFEGDVIDAVCHTLIRYGYEIEQRLNTTQQGDDIIATKNRKDCVVEIRIEAKGETSSDVNSKRYGKPFGSAQISNHVANAVYRGVEVLSRPNPDGRCIIAGLGFPKTELHQRTISKVLPVLRRLEIVIFWVGSDLEVDVVGEDQL